MIKKWKVTPVSSKVKAQPYRPDSRSKDDTAGPNRTTEVIQLKQKKPRRHTTGDTKQTIEDIRLAKELVGSMNGQSNPAEQGADPNTTLGRKQLISMLKQRYGNEMDSFRTTGELSEKERIRKERQRERDLRHNQRMTQENREMNHHGGVHHSPAMNGNREHFSGTGSEGSDDSLHMGTGGQRRYVTHTKSTKHRLVRRSDSEDDASKNGSSERLQPPPATVVNNNIIRSKGVVFLQYTDDVKRVNLPATVTSIATLKALFVNSFPDRISMQEFDEGAKVVYIKDADTGTYYMLEDINDVLNRSFLKIHEKTPSIQSGSQSTLVANSESSQISENSPQQPIHDEFHVTSPRVPAVNTHLNKNGHNHNGVTHTHAVNGAAHTQPPNASSHVHIKNNNSRVYNQDVNGSRDQMNGDKNKSHESVYSNVSSTVNGDSGYNRAPTSYEVHSTIHDVLRTPIVKTRTDSYNSSASKADSVEDQLDDLTELLKSALDEEEQHHAEIMECVNTKNPGKLDPSLVENIQRETQTLARKNTLPKYFQPTIMVAAQQESDRRTSERSHSESEPPKVAEKPTRNNGPRTTTSFKMKVGKQVSNDDKNANDFNNNNKANFDTKSEVVPQTLATEDNISPPHKRLFSFNNNTGANDTVDGPSATEVPPQVVNEDVATPKISDVLMDQIMDMELEVKARSNYSLRNSQRSSTGSSCSKSSIPCTDKLNTSNEDHPKLERSPLVQTSVENHYTNMHDTFLTEPTPVVVEDNTVNDTYSVVSKPKSTPNGDEENVNPGGYESTEENVFTNGPSMQHIYASISKVTELPTSSKVTTTFSNTTKSNLNRSLSGTGEAACHHHASVITPDFIELEDSAKSVHTSLQLLRQDLSDLRKCHVDGVKSFKADMQKKLLEFRKKASRVDEVLQQRLVVNNNIIFANEHPVRERRHRLTGDQLSYNKKMSDTELRLKFLEGDMEKVRVSVVTKKRVDDPQSLKDLHGELTMLTKGLAEIKNRFHGLHDMLKIVMPDEMKIISHEERFLKEEPQKLEGLIGRCKVLSGTLFTLERLASVQLEHGETQSQQQPVRSQSQSTPITTTTRNSEYSNYKQTNTTAANYNYNQSAPMDDVFDIEDLKGKRNVRFSHKN